VAAPAHPISRPAEREVLDRLLAEAAAHRGRVLWIEGEPGIGKSALLAQLCAAQRERGGTVLQGRAQELTQRFPLRALTSCFDSAGDADAPACGGRPAPGPVVPLDPVSAASERLLEQVERLCAVGPVVLAIDDAQWADEASLAALARLAQIARQLPLLLAVACGPVPRRAEVERAKRTLAGEDMVRLVLSPLTGTEVEEYVGALLGAPAGASLAAAVRRAGGNPLYIREVLDAYRRDGSIVRAADGTADIAAGAAGPPPALAVAIADRLACLPAAVHDLLRFAALLGADFTVSDLSAAAGLPEADLSARLGQAIDGGVLSRTGQDLTFRHSVIHEVLYASMPGGLRSALHGQIAVTLAGRGAPPEQVAEHLSRTAEVPGGWLVAWLLRFAERLTSTAPAVAADLLASAVELPGTGREDLAELLTRLSGVLFTLGRYQDVQRAAASATARLGPAGLPGQIVWNQAYTLVRMARYDEALSIIARALAGPGPPGDWRLRLAALRAMTLAHHGQPDAAEQEATAVLRAAAPGAGGPTEPAAPALGTGPDVIASGYALHTLMLGARMRSDHLRVLALAEQALSLVGDDPRAADLALLVSANRARSEWEVGRPADAHIADMLVRTERAAGHVRVGTSRLTAAEIWFRGGRWDDCAAELELLEAGLPAGESQQLMPMHGLAALVAVHRADDAAARRHLDITADQKPDAGNIAADGSYLARARALWTERFDGPGAALELMQSLWYDAGAASARSAPVWLADLIRLAHLLGEPELAGQVAGAVQEPPTGMVRSDLDSLAVARWCAALVTADAPALLAVAEMFGAAGRLFERGRVLEDAAVLVAGAGDSTAARELAGTVTGCYSALRAAWDLQRVEARLRPFGIRRGRHGRRGRPATGWDALTDTELRVADLVAQGLSNPDIARAMLLSKRTVETHIAHIRGKLHTRSRAEMAHEVIRHRQVR
jgi:DNA-binding CsgD family transcriptional regulator